MYKVKLTFPTRYLDAFDDLYKDICKANDKEYNYLSYNLGVGNNSISYDIESITQVSEVRKFGFIKKQKVLKNVKRKIGAIYRVREMDVWFKVYKYDDIKTAVYAIIKKYILPIDVIIIEDEKDINDAVLQMLFEEMLESIIIVKE